MRNPGHDRTRQRVTTLLSVLLMMAGLVGFAGSAAFAAGTTQNVSIGASLSPKDVTVPPGTTVTWTSSDSGRHRVESLDGAPAELKSKDITAGQSWSFTFTAAGTYPYVDKENKDNLALHGTITVGTGAPSPGGSPGPGGGPGPAPAPAPAAVSVSLANKAFSPASVTVAVGGVVTWTNNDSMPHNVTSNTAGAFTSTTLSPGAVFTFRFTAPGTYTYTCTFHGGMNGTVIVPTATGTVPPPPPPGPPAAGPGPVVPPVAVPAAPGKPGKHIVSITDAGFTPASLAANAGDTVTWTNTGKMPHTATAAGGAFDLAIGPGASGSTVLQKPGTIQYVCTYHSYMTATIVVSAALPGVVVAPPSATPGGAAVSSAGAGGSAAAPVAGGLAKTYQVSVTDNSFSPATVQARVGDTIVWTNSGKMPHTVTAGDGSFNKTPLAPGATYSYSLRAQGTVPYVCSFHPGMNGTLVVGAALAGVAVPPAGANGSSSAATGGTPPAAAAPASSGNAKTIEIKVGEMSFTPTMANANVGDTISWVNVGQIPHTVTAKDGSFDKTPLAPGQRFNYVLRKEGSISYVCSYHPGMDGMLMVGPALAGVKVPGASAAGGSGAPALAAPLHQGTATTYEVQVKENSFTPATVNARVGDTVTWVNVGTTPHTVTAKNHAFDQTLKPGQRFSYPLTEEGTIEYVCTPHHGMFGTLIVGPAPTPPVGLAGLSQNIKAMSIVSGVLLVAGVLLMMRLLAAARLRASQAGDAPRPSFTRRHGSPQAV